MIDWADVEFENKFDTSVSVHPTAMVAKGAQLAKGVSIGPAAMVGPQVELGPEVVVGAQSVISGHTQVGARTKIYPFATVGSDPQDLKYAGESTRLIIGKDNLIREYANISTGTASGGGLTRIGDKNLIMVYSHIAHDCIVGNHCVFANGVHLAGHVVVQDFSVFGGMSGAHQFCRFGERTMVAAGAIVVQDVPPYCLVQGDRARINGLNIVGLRRAGFSREHISQIKQMFKLVFNENITLEKAIERIRLEVDDFEQRNKFLDFLTSTSRGICR